MLESATRLAGRPLRLVDLDPDAGLWSTTDPTAPFRLRVRLEELALVPRRALVIPDQPIERHVTHELGHRVKQNRSEPRDHAGSQ